MEDVEGRFLATCVLRSWNDRRQRYSGIPHDAETVNRCYALGGERFVSGGYQFERVRDTLTKRPQTNIVRYAAFFLNRGTFLAAHQAVAASAIEKNNAMAELAYLSSYGSV